MAETTRSRGRPRSFDTDEALRAISDAFRTHGFAATSLDMISQATGLARPSLYLAFGDKEAMYLRALKAFSDRAARTAIPALMAGDTVEASLDGFYAAMLDIYFDGGRSARGCLIYATAPAAASHARVKKALSRSVDRLVAAFDKRFRDLVPGMDETASLAAAEAAAATLNGLSTRAAAGTPRPQLDAVAARAAAMIGRMCRASCAPSSL